MPASHDPPPQDTGLPDAPAMRPARAEEAERALDRCFAALADPTRRAILTMLLEDDLAVSDVAAPFAISLAAISKHLTILTAAGLIVQERRGRVKWCKLEPQGMHAMALWMQGFGQLQPLDLDAFERFLEQELAPDALSPHSTPD